MSITDETAWRERLLAERDDTLGRLRALRGTVADIVAASYGSNADDEHDPEGATIAFDRAQTDALVQQAVRHFAEVDAALARLDAGAYGYCEVCGEPIPEARLRARPTARTDVEHS